MTNIAEESAIDLARKCCNKMNATDYLAQHMAMEIADVLPGKAILSMRVQKFMLNGFGNCHGGMIFSLADTAFAYACNSRNQANVAMDCRIDFLNAAFEGDELTATASEVHQGRRSGLYAISVVNQNNVIVAQFSGRSYYINRPVMAAADDD